MNILTACSQGSGHQKTVKTADSYADSSLVNELKISNQEENYLIRIMNHPQTNEKSLNIYKQGKKDFLIPLFHSYGEYVDASVLTIVDQEETYSSNIAFTQNGDMLFAFAGQGSYTNVITIAENKKPVWYSSARGCFLFDKSSNLLVWDTGDHLSDDLGDHAEMTYYAGIPGGTIKSVRLFDNNTDYKQDRTLCFQDDNSFKTIKAIEQQILDVINKHQKK